MDFTFQHENQDEPHTLYFDIIYTLIFKSLTHPRDDPHCLPYIPTLEMILNIYRTDPP